MLRKPLIGLLAAVGAVALLVGCASAKEPVKPTPIVDPIESVVDTTWGFYTKSSADRGKPHITFIKNGEFYGSDGCNNIFGSYTLSDKNEVSGTLNEMASTMMFCEGVDTWLSKAKTFDMAGGNLVFEDENGKELAELKLSKEFNKRDADVETPGDKSKPDPEVADVEGPNFGSDSQGKETKPSEPDNKDGVIDYREGDSSTNGNGVVIAD